MALIAKVGTTALGKRIRQVGRLEGSPLADEEVVSHCKTGVAVRSIYGYVFLVRGARRIRDARCDGIGAKQLLQCQECGIHKA